MKLFCLLLAGAIAATAVAADFFRPGFDDGKDLPADRIYPAGRIFPFTGFSPASVAATAKAGFSMAGPVYSDGQMRKLKAGSELLPIVWPLRAVDGRTTLTRKLLDNPNLDLEPYVESIEKQVRKSASNSNIAWWYLMPEELRPWRKLDMEFLHRAVAAIRNNDSERRPVWMYLPNHYNAEQLRPFAAELDIIGKGMYPSQFDKERERVWCRWSMESETEAIRQAGSRSIPIAVVEMFRQPSSEMLTRVESLVRHDIYLALISGAKGIAVFSLAERSGFSAHPRYFDAYAFEAGRLGGPEGIGQIFLFGRPMNDLKVKIVKGPERLKTTPIPRKEEVREYPSIAFAELGWRDNHVLALVNSSDDTQVTVEISGLPAEPVRITDLITNQEYDRTSSGTFQSIISPYQAVCLKFNRENSTRGEK